LQRNKRRKSWSLLIDAVPAGSACPEVCVLGATMSQEREVM
jgi:hypothetical protein